MLDPLAIARDRLSKAEARVQRLEKQLDSARGERDDLQTTVRVMAGLLGETTGSEAVNAEGRQKEILLLLPDAPTHGASPATLYETYKLIGDDEISLDTFRTTIWRMKGNLFMLPHHGNYMVNANDGKYWKEELGKKEAPDVETPRASNSMGLAGRGGSASHPASDGSSPSRSTPVQAAYDGDLDDDVPF